MLRIAQALDTQLREAMQRAFPEVDALLDPQLAPASKPEFGDFQANGALPLAKPLKQAPRQIAGAIVEALQANPAFAALCLEPQIAGPGFINLTIRPECLAAEVSARIPSPEGPIQLLAVSSEGVTEASRSRLGGVAEAS